MEGQGKRLLLAVALALGVMLLWQVIFPPKKDDVAKKPTAGSGEVVVAPTSPVGPVGPTTTPTTPDAPAAPGAAAPPVAAPRGEEQKITLSFPKKFDATFSSYGGNLISFRLGDDRFEHDRKKKSAHPFGEMLPVDRETGAPLPNSGSFGVNFSRSSTFHLPAETEWKGEKVSDTQVRYTLSTPNLEIEKTFTVEPEVFLVRMAVKVTVKPVAGAVAQQELAVIVHAFQDPKKIEGASGQGQDRAWASSTLRAGEIYHTPVTSLLKAPREETGLVWTGFEHPYLLAAYAPKVAPGSVISKFSSADPSGLMRTDILFGTTKFESPSTTTQEVVAYLGPKNYMTLEKADEAAGFATNFKETIDLGWFAFIGKPLLWLLLKFHAFFGNWGIAIILLTFLVKAATLYWTTKSMRSMKAMAALAPQMKLLQEKYKEDRQRLQAETMSLYKTHGVNPVAGCLPILLQMPIWLALYRMLSSAGELYQQPFIPGWIDDLTATDPYYILPFILVATMFGQARLTPVTGDSRQQKMIQYGMPLMFGVMSFFFPAGLTLYIFTNTVLSALHSIWMNKYDKKSLAVVAEMKKKADDMAREAAGAKPAGKGAPGKNGAAKPAVAKPVIDVEAVDTSDDEDDAESPAVGAGSAASAGARSRKKPKKRRR